MLYMWKEKDKKILVRLHAKKLSFDKAFKFLVKIKSEYSNNKIRRKGMIIMATKKEINNLLKELNISKDDMQRMYDELTDIDSYFKAWKNSERNWTDLNIYTIQNIPTGKQRVLENIEKKKLEEEEQKKAKEYEQYYKEHFEEIMVQKIDSCEELTERELSKLTGYEIEHEEGENRRWTRTITSIIELCGRYFALDWKEGLTECQDNFFYKQPYEVEKIEYEKTIPASIITIKEWKPLKKKDK